MIRPKSRFEVDKLYAFGPFVADPVTGTLRQDGAHVVLTLKSFEVLLALIERRGQVVDKDVLLKLVWPDTIVEENNLARHISTLRKALNDHPPDHQFIVTVPGRGYRFVAPVQELARSEIPPPRPAPPPGAGCRSQRCTSRQLPSSRSAAQSFARTRAVGTRGGRSRRGRHHRHRAARQLSSQRAGCARSKTVAVDVERRPRKRCRRGRRTDRRSRTARIATATSTSGRSRSATSQPVRLTSSPSHDWQPSWSPDGKLVAFRSERDGGGMFVVSGGGRTTNAESRISVIGRNGRLASRRSCFPARTPSARSYMSPRADGGQLRQVLSAFLDEFASYRAAWHPDGHRISVFGSHRRDGISFWTVSLDGTSPVRSPVSADVAIRLKKTGVNLTEFVWSPLADALYFEGRSEEAVNIWRIGVDPQSMEWRDGPERVTVGGGLDTEHRGLTRRKEAGLHGPRRKHAALVAAVRSDHRARARQGGADHAEGGRRAVSRRPTQRHAGRLPHDSPRQARAAAAIADRRRGSRWCRSQGDMLVPRWSDDGTMLAFRRRSPAPSSGGCCGVRSCSSAADGSNERNLTAPGPREFTPYDWSADGKWILASCEHGPTDRTDPSAWCPSRRRRRRTSTCG